MQQNDYIGVFTVAVLALPSTVDGEVITSLSS